MTVVDLSKIKIKDPVRAIKWIVDTWGPAGDRWMLKDLCYVEFKKDRDATLFLIHWS